MKLCPVCSTEYPDDVRFCPNDGQTLRAAAPAGDLVGQVVADRYHVLRKLGEGGMGQVYLAEHVKMGRRSAIKVMNPSMVHDPDAVSRFNREAANASRITHPNVCAIYDFGETADGTIYLAMEFIEGEPLTSLLERDGALPPLRAAHIVVQVAEALQAAHDLGIVHRDLKPDNVMVGRGRDGADVVKVVDFGIAKAVGGEDSQKVTKTGLVVGTPEFMSPEQLAGDKLDGRSDIYSLALVLYKMLTGKLPFEATTVQETMIKRLTDDPLTLAAVRPDRTFPAGLQETLDAALTRSPADRYQSAAKFANDLAAVTGLGRGAGAASPLPATRGGGDEGKTQLLDAGGTARIAARTPPVQRRSFLPAIVGAVVLVAAGGGYFALGRRSGASHAETTQPPATDTARRDSASSQRMLGTHNPSRIDPAKVGGLLDALIDRPTAVILDSASVVYETPGVSAKDRAFAACMLAQAYSTERNNAKALDWAKAGLRLDPNLQSCRRIVQSVEP